MSSGCFRAPCGRKENAMPTVASEGGKSRPPAHVPPCFAADGISPAAAPVVPERRWWRRLSWISGLFILFALIAVVTHLREEERLLLLVRRAQPAWLLAAAVFQAATYLCAAGVWQRVLRQAGIRLRLRALVPLAVARLFTDQVFPTGGFGGRLLVVRGLRHRGVDLPAAMAAILVDLITLYVAFSAAVLVTLGILWRFHGLSKAILTAAALFSLLATAIPLTALWLSHGGGIPRWARRLPRVGDLLAQMSQAPRHLVRDRAVLLPCVARQLAIFLLDSATLWAVLRAAGWPTGPAEAFASHVMALLTATIILLIPGGLGTYEAACVAMLTLFHVPVEAALAATLLQRGFTYWLPMLPGLWLSRREIRTAGLQDGSRGGRMQPAWRR